MSSLIAFLEEILIWLKDLLLWIPRKLSELVLDGLATVIEAIPVPSFLANAPSYLGSIGPLSPKEQKLLWVGPQSD